jgi:hypothetical protein
MRVRAGAPVLSSDWSALVRPCSVRLRALSAITRVIRAGFNTGLILRLKGAFPRSGASVRDLAAAGRAAAIYTLDDKKSDRIGGRAAAITLGRLGATLGRLGARFGGGRPGRGDLYP